MASLINTIAEELISAQRNKDEIKVSTLRLLISEVKNAQIAKGGELTDDEVLGQIQKAAKKRKESIDAYEKASRTDLADKEKAELEILSKYLPAQMSEDDIAKVVDGVILSMKASGPGDMGRVMGEVMGKLKGQADGNTVSRLVREKLDSG